MSSADLLHPRRDRRVQWVRRAIFRAAGGLLSGALLCVLLAAGASVRLGAETPEERENALKAGFLFNFFTYVQWPQRPNEAGETPLVLGVVGDATSASLVEALQGKTARGRRIEVRMVGDAKAAGACHLVFVTASGEPKVHEILGDARAAGVLTVGEVAGFLHEGGIINLVPARNRFQIEINPDAAEKAGLTISSQLLKLARIVRN